MLLLRQTVKPLFSLRKKNRDLDDPQIEPVRRRPRLWAKGVLEVLLIRPGGPFWAKKDAGSWSIPKGLYNRR
jgi:hypothetical protein